MRSRRTLALLAAVVAVLCAFTFAQGASAASGGCQLKGTASFAPGLSTTSQPFNYSFSGDLTNCQSTEAGSPATGFVQAGGTYTDPASGKAYTLPSSTGTGGCASSTTQGLALITWGDGTQDDRAVLDERSGRGREPRGHGDRQHDGSAGERR